MVLDGSSGYRLRNGFAERHCFRNVVSLFRVDNTNERGEHDDAQSDSLQQRWERFVSLKCFPVHAFARSSARQWQKRTTSESAFPSSLSEAGAERVPNVDGFGR